MSSSLGGTPYIPMGKGAVVWACAIVEIRSNSQGRHRFILPGILIEQGGFGSRFDRGRCGSRTSKVGGALVNLDHARQAIGILWALVPADALDARKAQGVAAGVPLRLLDLVAGDLQDDLRFDE